MQISKFNLIKPCKFTIIIALLLFLFQACKKADIVNGADKNSPATVSMQAKDFFTISANAPDAEKAIVKEMQKQFKENDVQDFLKWHGQPLWSRIIKFEEDKNGSVTYAIPTQKNNEITGFFAATIDKANVIKLEMHRKAAIALKKGEYTYADINSDRSIAIFNIFNNKTKNSEQTNSLFLHCWFEWVEQTTFQKTTTSNMESVVHHPRGYWELICMETGGGGTGGGGGGTGGEDTGGGGTGGCGGGWGHDETFNYKWWSNESSLLSPCNLLEAINRLSYFLELNTTQLNWLRTHLSMVEELDRYIGGGGSQQTNQIAKDHLDKMMSDYDYLTFVESHSLNGDQLKMWWDDDTWLTLIKYQMPETAFNFYMQNTRPQNKKPEEFADKCLGIIQMAEGTRNDIYHKERVGCLTIDGKIIITDVGTESEVKFSVKIKNNTTYYYYPLALGLPTLSYSGMIIENNEILIPIRADIHTHDGYGESIDWFNSKSSGDLESAQLMYNNPFVKNYVIEATLNGKYSVGTFDHDDQNKNYNGVTTGLLLSELCPFIF